jgi:hypothetical protein
VQDITLSGEDEYDALFEACLDLSSE